jgi:hypothetical protein
VIAALLNFWKKPEAERVVLPGKQPKWEKEDAEYLDAFLRSPVGTKLVQSLKIGLANNQQSALSLKQGETLVWEAGWCTGFNTALRSIEAHARAEVYDTQGFTDDEA